MRALLRAGTGLRDLETDADLDLERDLDKDLRRKRDLLGEGEGLMDSDVGRLLLRGLGEGDREISLGVVDLRRRVPRSGLRPLPLPPRPLYESRLSGVLDLDLRLRGLGDRDLEEDRYRRRGGERERLGDLAGDAELTEERRLLSSLPPSLLGPPRPRGTYVSASRKGRNERSLESRLLLGGDLEKRCPRRSKSLGGPRSKSLFRSSPRPRAPRQLSPRPPIPPPPRPRSPLSRFLILFTSRSRRCSSSRR